MDTFLRRARYRSFQFFQALGARTTAEDRNLVVSVLKTPPQQALFEHMPAADQRHALALLRTLQAEGHDHPALMQAALLYDVAKSGAGVTILHRVAVVLLRALRPTWLTWLIRNAEGSWWRRPFALYVDHPAIGARWAEVAGCHPLAVSIIRRHQLPVPLSSEDLEDCLLRLLQAADDEN
jgi:hypothetical protein